MNAQLSWMEQSLGPRGARALLAAIGSGAVALSIPVALLERVAQSSGIADILPLLAAPIGLTERIMLAILVACAGAALVWAFWGMRMMRTMQQARKVPAFGWGALLRRVRGHTGDAHANPDQAVLVRRRRDLHPDAPPRPPLFASRDLPTPDAELNPPVATTPDLSPLPQPIVEAQDAPSLTVDLPRSPPPMSEADIAQTLAGRLAAMTGSPAPAAPVPAPAVPQVEAPIACESPASRPAPSAAAPLVETVRALDLPLIADADLAMLSARFEKGVVRRELLQAAAEAQAALDERLAYARSDAAVRAALRSLRPMEVVPDLAMSAPAPVHHHDVDADIEMVLDQALATLRALTEQGRR